MSNRVPNQRTQPVSEGGAAEWWFATSNPHKVREAADILAALGIRLRHLGEHPGPVVEPEETGLTFADNARLKALSYAAQLGRRCLAEDSGLVVEALDGRPGVHSARYSGDSGPRELRDPANNEKLLFELRAVPDAERQARFVSAVCVADPDGTVVAEAFGTLEGMIGRAPVGSFGFGYDPLLILPELGRTSGELLPEEKNERSHRGRALRALVAHLGGTSPTHGA